MNTEYPGESSSMKIVREGVKSPFDSFDFLTGLQVCFWLVIFKRICGLNPPEADEGFITRSLGDN